MRLLERLGLCRRPALPSPRPRVGAYGRRPGVAAAAAEMRARGAVRGSTRAVNAEIAR